MRCAEQVVSQSLSLLLRSSESPTGPVQLGSLRLPYLLLLHGRYRMPYVSQADSPTSILLLLRFWVAFLR